VPILYATVTTDAGEADILDDGEVMSYSQNADLTAPPSGLLMAFSAVRTNYFTVEGGLADPYLNYDLSYTFYAGRLGFLPPPWVGYPTYVIATSAGDLVMDPMRQKLYDWFGYVEVCRSEHHAAAVEARAFQPGQRLPHSTYSKATDMDGSPEAILRF